MVHIIHQTHLHMRATPARIKTNRVSFCGIFRRCRCVHLKPRVVQQSGFMHTIYTHTPSSFTSVDSHCGMTVNTKSCTAFIFVFLLLGCRQCRDLNPFHIKGNRSRLERTELDEIKYVVKKRDISPFLGPGSCL